MKNLEFKYVKIHPKATVPAKVSGNLAFDLHVVRDEKFYEHNWPGQPNDFRYILKPGERRVFHTGLKIAIPTGYGLIVQSYPILSVKYGLYVFNDIINPSCIDELTICIFNSGSKIYEIVECDIIAQAIIIQGYSINFIENKGLDNVK